MKFRIKEQDKPITVGVFPIGVVVLDDGDKIYVVNSSSGDVSILEQ